METVEKQSKTWLWVIMVVVLAGIIYLLATLGGGNTTTTNPTGVAADTSPIKIGASFPMTGEAASYGEAVAAAAQLAVKEVNDAGGINGRKIEFIIEDDTCTSKKGVNAITKLAEIDKVVAMIGPVCSAAAGPGLPVAQKNNLPVVITTASAPNLTKIGDHIFRIYFSDAFQGKFAAEYIFNTLKKTKVAVLYVKNDWGQGINEVFVNRFKELGGQVVFDEGVAQDIKDFRTLVTKLRAAKPDVVYTALYPASGSAAIKQLKELAVNVPIVGGDAFDGEEIWRVKEAEGVLYTVAKTYDSPVFREKLNSFAGKEVYQSFAAFAYDAIKILAQVIGRVGTDHKAIIDELAKTVYKGAESMPVIEFGADREVKNVDFKVLIIKGGKSELYTEK
ncbi:MAG: ABC transporter substrate-binding protein [Patescibacteria group bacterium]|nr:ABC transporter substrate-binding protein [Patescibacteria group bacterium]